MTQTLEQPNALATSNGNGELAVTRRGAVVDASEFANLLDSNKFEHLWRVAKLFSASQLVPQHYQGQPENCFIASQMAMRMGVDPFMFMQNTYIVHGRPGMEAKLVIALINSSGLFTDSIDYEIEGVDPAAPAYRVRAFAVRKSTGKRIDGPWVDWKIVKAERWDGKDGSKWRTMPGLMFQYRAAAWFGRLHCPERLMGMQTVDEIHDVEAVAGAAPTIPTVSERGVKGLMTRIGNVTHRPVSEGQTFVPDPAAIDQAEAEQPALSDADAEAKLREVSPSAKEPNVEPANQVSQEQEADVGDEMKLAALHDALDDIDDAKRNLYARAKAITPSLMRSTFEGALFKALQAMGIGDIKATSFEHRVELFKAIEAGAFGAK